MGPRVTKNQAGILRIPNGMQNAPMDVETMPPPPPLTRQNAEQGVDEAMVARYLQYECKYKAAKYKDPCYTWGELVEKDYAHFVDLMSHEVPVESNTFVALQTQFRTAAHLQQARSATRNRDTPEGRIKQQNDFLMLKCSHRGRMNGKTWREIRATDYSYFVWAIGNTMSRDTKTFKIFHSCIHAAEQELVNSMPKGQVKVPKGLKWQKFVDGGPGRKM